MRKLASIQKVHKIVPIQGADAIEIVKIKGWQCVSKKGEFQEGDFCVYFEIDSLLPPKDPFMFLEKGNKIKTMCVDGNEYQGFKLKTIRLRGCLSQGLALPTNLFSEFNIIENLYEDLDVSEILGIIKWEETIPENMTGLMRGGFPSFIPKTDEERIQNINFNDFNIGEYYITEKIDGSSITMYKQEGYVGVCSRNIDLLEGDNAYWNTMKKYNLHNTIPEGFAIQGEIWGAGMQGNIYKQKELFISIYNIYNIQQGIYLSFDEMILMCKELGLQFVPILDEKLPELTNENIDNILLLAEGRSKLGDTEREGIVVRSNSEGNKISFKAISNSFLLKQ